MIPNPIRLTIKINHHGGGGVIYRDKGDSWAVASPESSKQALQADTEVQWASAGVLGFLCSGVKL